MDTDIEWHDVESICIYVVVLDRANRPEAVLRCLNHLTSSTFCPIYAAWDFDAGLFKAYMRYAQWT